MPVKHRTNNAAKGRGKNREALMRIRDLKAYLGNVVSVGWINKRLMCTAAREKHRILGDPIPCRYLGGVVVFDPREIDAWLKRQPRRRRKRNGQTIFAALEHAQLEEVAGGPR